MIAGRKHSRFRDPHAIRLIRWIHACIDSAASFGQSVMTASRNAGKRAPGPPTASSPAQGLLHFGQLASPRSAQIGRTMRQTALQACIPLDPRESRRSLGP